MRHPRSGRQPDPEVQPGRAPDPRRDRDRAARQEGKARQGEDEDARLVRGNATLGAGKVRTLQVRIAPLALRSLQRHISTSCAFTLSAAGAWRDRPCPAASPAEAVSGERVESPHAGRVAQWESARFTRERSLVRAQPCPLESPCKTGSFSRPLKLIPRRKGRDFGQGTIHGTKPPPRVARGTPFRPPPRHARPGRFRSRARAAPRRAAPESFRLRLMRERLSAATTRAAESRGGSRGEDGCRSCHGGERGQPADR
jgi:hypothetical protein